VLYINAPFPLQSDASLILTLIINKKICHLLITTPFAFSVQSDSYLYFPKKSILARHITPANTMPPNPSSTCAVAGSVMKYHLPRYPSLCSSCLYPHGKTSIPKPHSLTNTSFQRLPFSYIIHLHSSRTTRACYLSNQSIPHRPRAFICPISPCFQSTRSNSSACYCYETVP